MNFEFRVFKTPTPWNTFFADRKELVSGIWDGDYIVAVALVNGSRFAHVVLDANFAEPVAPPSTKVLGDEDEDDEDKDDDGAYVPTVRLSSSPRLRTQVDPDKKYFIQHTDDFLTPFISYAATIPEAEAHCLKAAKRFVEFVAKANAVEVKSNKAKVKSESEDMIEFVKLGWSFMFNKAHRPWTWTATKQGSPQCWSGATWKSAMRRGLETLRKQARKTQFPKL